MSIIFRGNKTRGTENKLQKKYKLLNSLSDSLREKVYTFIIKNYLRQKCKVFRPKSLIKIKYNNVWP